MLRLGFKSVIGVDCSLAIAREGDYWVACVSCPPSDEPHNCARASDLALALRWVLPCYREYAHVFGRIELLTEVRPCERFE